MRDWIKRSFAKAAVAVAVAFVGAVPMAEVSGFYRGPRPEDSVAVFAAGAILFLLTWVFAAPMVRGASRLIASCARVETRPGPGIALSLILCGTLCVVGSLWGAWSSRSTPAVSEMTDAVRQMERSMSALHAQGMQNINFNLTPPLTPNAAGPMALTALGFLFGSAMIALGAWSSFGPHAPDLFASYPNGFARKHPIPAADETRL